MNQNANITTMKTDKSIDEQAVHWFTIMNDEALSQQNQQAFSQWYARSSLHRNAFKNIAKVWDKTGFSDDVIEHRTNNKYKPNANQTSPAKYKKMAGVMAIAATILVAIFTLLHTGEQPHFESTEVYAYSTATAEIKNVILPDGSELILGPQSSVSFTESDSIRTANLHHGKAFFDVISMPNKPFTVASGANIIEVTGTEFEVSAYRTMTQVSVVEGSVRVSSKSVNGSSVSLTPGERVSAPLEGGPLSTISMFHNEDALAWMNNKLVFNNTPINEFLYQIQPYVEQKLTLKGENVDAVTINTIVTPSNVHTLLDSLPAAYSLDVVRTHDAITFTYSENTHQ